MKQCWVLSFKVNRSWPSTLSYWFSRIEGFWCLPVFCWLINTVHHCINPENPTASLRAWWNFIAIAPLFVQLKMILGCCQAQLKQQPSTWLQFILKFISSRPGSWWSWHRVKQAPILDQNAITPIKKNHACLISQLLIKRKVFSFFLSWRKYVKGGRN